MVHLFHSFLVQETFSIKSGSPYPIDEKSISGVYTPSPSELTAKVTPNSKVTSNTPTTYEFELTPKKVIETGGKVTITFPATVTFPTGSSDFTACRAVIGGSSRSVTCTVTKPVSTNIFVTITGAFTSAFTTMNTAFLLQLDGIRNPKTTDITAAFTITTLSASNSPIESSQEKVTTQMESSSEMTQFTVSTASAINGATNEYTFRVRTQTPMESGDKIQFTFPSQNQFAQSSHTSTIVSGLSAVSCSRSSYTMKCTLTFSSSPYAALTEFAFKISDIINPPSTLTTSAFTNVQTLTSADKVTSIFKGTTTVRTTTSATVITKALVQENKNYAIATKYSITFTTINYMPSGFGILMSFPTSITLGSSITCQINYGSLTTFDVEKFNNNSIKITKDPSFEIPAGKSVTITLTPITNPATLNSDAISFVTYINSLLTDSIDTAGSIIPNFECTLPCRTCSSTIKTSCQSCFTDSSTTLKYHNNTSCLAACPDGTYDSAFFCKTCPTTCKTCYNATDCKTCDTAASSLYKLFLNNTCLATCPVGYFNLSNTCTKCNSNCLTCSGSATNCTTCAAPILFNQNGRCQSSCETGSVAVGFTCKQCTQPCATCAATQTSCTSCSTGYLYGTQCIDECPNGSIFQNGKCVACDPNCQICSPTVTAQCLLCKKGMILFNNTCFTSCPTGYFPDSKNITCQSPSGTGVALKEINPYNNIYAFFPFLITTLLLGGVAVASWFKDKSSLITSNAIALWGPVETIAYAAQLFLAYAWITNIQYAVDDSTTTVTSRRFLGEVAYLKYFEGEVIPIVFYGTAIGIAGLIGTNIAFFVLHMHFIRNDSGYIRHKRLHQAVPLAIAIVGSALSFKVGNFLYSKFFGWRSFFVPFEKFDKLHHYLNILSIINIVITLVPICAVDLYGLYMYKWGSQFYMIQIETLIIALIVFAFTVWEIKKQKNILKLYRPDDLLYSAVGDQSSIEDQIMKRMEEEIRKRFGGLSMEEFIENLKNQKALEAAANMPKKNLKRGESMGHLGDRTREVDERRLNTDPLDKNQKKKYEGFEIDKHPDNCYAESGKGEPTTVDPSRRAVKVIQYGEFAQNGEDYDKDYDRRIRELFHGRNPADERGDSRYLSKLGQDTLDEDLKRPGDKKKGRLRGRKGKYYEQVDDEDQSFLQDQENMIKDDDDDLDDEDQKLDMIEEESHHTLDHEEDKLNKLEDQIVEDNLNANNQMSVIEDDDAAQLLMEDENQLFEVEEAKGEGAMVEAAPGNGLGSPNKLLQDGLDIDGTNPNFKSTIEVQNEIENEFKNALNVPAPNFHLEEEEIIKNVEGEELGEPDSDDDDDQRIANMRDLDKKRFNVNDILGDFDRDEKGNLVILQENKTGNLIDKEGNRVNEKGYLVDEKTGDVVEKERGKKVFDAKELDERGELPPPYNLERFNFNIHDVRGYFDRDADGNEIIGNRKDGYGNLIDKQGKRVNELGYLVDNDGNLVDKRGRVKLHKSIMEQNNGDIPLLFNYKGKKFDIQDVMGNLDKDRNGNIIIRRDKDNQMVDKQGRRVNNKGYLIDKDGNVINKDGKIMFELFSLSKDNEIPKLFPFLKFNIDDIKGDYELDPLSNPMLQRTRDGDLVDSKGRKVNEKGYLIDEDGHIRNKRGHRVFSKMLLEDGDIPKVFRTGLLRKDTYDSFSQLMSEIEDLERMQEMDIDDPRRQAMKNKMAKENERLQKRIDKIVEEDNDDDDMLMREVEKLANGRNSDNDGGNTSVESQMEDTPSNYNVLNQRFNEVEDIKNQARLNLRNHPKVVEDDEFESEYSYLPGKKLKKKKKKKKKKPEKEIDLRELKMAVAYGSLSQAQYDKIVANKKLKDAQNMAAQMGQTSTSMMGAKPPIQRNASNTRMTTVQSKRALAGGQLGNRNNSMMGADDLISELGGAESVHHGQGGNRINMNGIQTAQIRHGTSTTRAAGNNMNKTTSRLNKDGLPSSQYQLKKNNLMSDKGESEASEKQNPGLADRDRRLSLIANSVSGFYKEGSEHSLMRSTHESNFAQNLGRRRGDPQPPGPLEELKQQYQRRPPDTAGFALGNLQGATNDPELDRIYGTARGLADLTQLSDWEKDSQRSGKSARSQFQVMNSLKVRGLENIYLQRLEPATKGRKTTLKKGQEKAKFRVMHHKYHDEPEWYVDDQRDELDSVISDNYKQMEKKFVQEFQGTSSGGKKQKISKDSSGANIFHGRLNQYKERIKQDKAGNGLDFNKQ